MSKRSLALVGVNGFYGENVYLPLAIGVLWATARHYPEITDEWSEPVFLYKKESIAKALAKLADPFPDLVAFSSYIWNWEWNCALARAIKEKSPATVTLFGGVHVPDHPSERFWTEHPEIDFLIHGEGEMSFTEFLKECAGSRDWSKVAGLSSRDGSSTERKLAPLDILRSPYLDGTFDRLLPLERRWQVLHETNRGCPYLCSFCLAGDTLVSMEHGKCEIKSLASQGHVAKPLLVWTHHPLAEALGEKNVILSRAVNVRRTGAGKVLWRVSFDGGGYIDCTEDHEFLTDGGKATMTKNFVGRYAKVLTMDDKRRLAYRRVCSIEELSGLHDVYCLEVPETGWFFANDVFVHNCEWGAAALNKIRPFPIGKVLEEIDWMGRNHIDYVDNADANMGILARDEEIIEKVVKTREKWGFPEKFRTSFAKYSNSQIAERVFRIAKMLSRSGQLKAVTLALQSTSGLTLDLIRRKNIALDGFAQWQDRYQAEGIPTYTELILGLPGETYESFASGINSVLDSGQHNGLFCYMLSKLPNSEMDNPSYIEEHGIEAVKMRALLTHGTPEADIPVEYQWTVVATKTMPHEDWKRAYMLAWIVQALHSFGVTQWWAIQERPRLSYVDFYLRLLSFAEQNPKTVLGKVYYHTQSLLEKALSGGSWNNVLPEFGDVSWPPDEGGFLLVAWKLEQFYSEMEFFLGMPSEQRSHGPPAVPRGKEEQFGRAAWYGRRGDVVRELQKVTNE